MSVAKSAITTSPRQRQAKRPTVDSPTSSVLYSIEKRRLHLEESSEIVIAVTKRKVCCPEDLNVKNGFKLSVFYTDQPRRVLSTLEGSSLCLRTHMQMQFAQENGCCSCG